MKFYPNKAGRYQETIIAFMENIKVSVVLRNLGGRSPGANPKEGFLMKIRENRYAEVRRDFDK